MLILNLLVLVIFRCGSFFYQVIFFCLLNIIRSTRISSSRETSTENKTGKIAPNTEQSSSVEVILLHLTTTASICIT